MNKLSDTCAKCGADTKTEAEYSCIIGGTKDCPKDFNNKPESVFEFRWTETISKKASVKFSDMEGSDVWYQPTNSDGRIVLRDSKLFIEWNDAEDTDLQTDHGLSILTECKIF